MGVAAQSPSRAQRVNPRSGVEARVLDGIENLIKQILKFICGFVV
jgi:hypothetical protein